MPQKEIAKCFEEWMWESDDLETALHTFNNVASNAVEVEVQRALTYAFTEYFKGLRLTFKSTKDDVIIEVDTWCEEFDGYEPLFNRKVSLLEQLRGQDALYKTDFLLEAVNTMRRLADKLEKEINEENENDKE